jgi:hypothetical protein
MIKRLEAEEAIWKEKNSIILKKIEKNIITLKLLYSQINYHNLHPDRRKPTEFSGISKDLEEVWVTLENLNEEIRTSDYSFAKELFGDN